MELKQDFGGSRLQFYTSDASSYVLQDFFSTHKVINRTSIIDFLLFGTVMPPHTPLVGVNQLYPGETRSVNTSHLELEDVRYEERSISLEQAVNDLDRLLNEYFSRNQGIETVLLSGGIDSAIIASYLPRRTYITWGGNGEQTPDVQFSRITEAKIPSLHHHFVYADFDTDFQLYKEMVSKLKVPILFNSAVPFIRMSREAVSNGITDWFMGQNADTLFMAYPAPILTKRLILLNKLLPINPLWWSQSRKRHLFSTDSIVSLMAYFKSLGVFPAVGLNVPEGYFEEKERLINRIPTRTLEQRIIITEELLTESRRNQICQHAIPSQFGITAHCPYYEREFVENTLTLPASLRRKGGYQKKVLKELAKKRGVPHEVIYKNKSGLSYGMNAFMAERRHIPIWNQMQNDPHMNSFLDVAAIRRYGEGNYLTFIMLASLYWWFELVAKPDNLTL